MSSIVDVLEVGPPDRRTIDEYADDPENNMTKEQVQSVTQPTGKIRLSSGRS